MLTSTAMLISGSTATVLTLAQDVPQFYNTVIRGRVAGVSWVRMWILVGGCAGWGIYGLLSHDAVLITTNVIYTALAVGMLVTLLVRVPAARASALRWVAALAAWVGVVTLAALRSTSTLGVLVVVIGTTLSVPQVVRMVRLPEEAKGGVSITSMYVRAAAATSWVTYAVITGSLTIFLPQVVSLPASVYGVVLLRRYRHASKTRAHCTDVRCTCIPET